MAIINDKGKYISYDCPELITDIKRDCIEFGGDRKVYAVCKTVQGVKICFDYIYDLSDQRGIDKSNGFGRDVWYEETTLRKLMAYMTRLNNPNNNYTNIMELFDASGMSKNEFAEYFDIPISTVDDWIKCVDKPKGYVLKLMQEKLLAEKII